MVSSTTPIYHSQSQMSQSVSIRMISWCFFMQKQGQGSKVGLQNALMPTLSLDTVSFRSADFVDVIVIYYE